MHPQPAAADVRPGAAELAEPDPSPPDSVTVGWAPPAGGPEAHGALTSPEEPLKTHQCQGFPEKTHHVKTHASCLYKHSIL